jgi:hypothetical protein
MSRLNTMEERRSAKLGNAIAGAIVLVAIIWTTRWYQTDTGPQSWVIHVAIWLLLWGLLSGVYTCARNIAGYKKQWVHWTKWEEI